MLVSTGFRLGYSLRDAAANAETLRKLGKRRENLSVTATQSLCRAGAGRLNGRDGLSVPAGDLGGAASESERSK